MSNRSDVPTVAALAMSADAPLLAADTYMLLVCERRATPPPPVVAIRSDEIASLLPVAMRLGVSAVKVHPVPVKPEFA